MNDRKADKRADRPRKGAASIRDVAALAKVSISTVSRVMNEPDRVAPETAARVQKAIERLGYVMSPTAGGRESHVIGLALPRFHGEFMTWLLHGADEEATRQGYHLMMTTIATSVDGHARRRIVGSDLIDALLVVLTEKEDPLADEVRASGVPTVVIDTDLSARGLDSVVLDNDRGTHEAVEHLLRWVAPRDLYFVGGPKGNFDSLQRAKAFTDALKSRGHTVTADQVVFGEYAVEWGKEWGVRMLQSPGAKKREGCVGVLAANDKIACGVMHVAEDAGVKIPDAIRIVGFNDSQISRLVRPTLSTVALPMQEMGAMAVRLLVRRIENRAAETVCSKLPTRLIVRESSTVVNF